MNPFDGIAGNPLVDRLACALVHSLWEGLLIAGVLALLLPALRGRPAARYAAAWLALVLMAGAVPLTAWFVPGSGAPRAIASAPGSGPRRTTPFEGATPAPARGETGRRATTADPSPVAPTDLAREAGVPGPDPVLARPVEFSPPFDLRAFVRPSAPWIVGAWAIGAILLALWRLGGWVYLHRLGRRGSAAPEVLQAVLDRLRGRLGVRFAVRLRESASVRVPAVVGWVRPVVLMPIGLLAGITPEQLELILAHELAHIRRRDFLANLIQTAIETGLFYHPAVWWISRTARIEREACCDDLVVAATGAPIPYAHALARLAEFCLESGAARRLHLPVAADGGDLLARVRRIVGAADLERRGTAPRLAGSLAVLGMMAGLAGYAAVAVEPTALATAPNPQAEAKPAPAAPRAEGERPRLLRVQPADGATDVEPETELRFRFDRPMDPDAAMIGWDYRGQAGFRLRGPLRYDPASHEFTLPVRLTPGQRHVLMMNGEGTFRKEAYEGFRAAVGPGAAPVRWSFTTAGAKPAAGGPAPRVVSVSPAPDAEVALMTPVEITFDRPMDPTSYGVAAPEFDNSGSWLELVEPVAYDAAARRFTLLFRFPPNWYGELRFEGFRDAGGAEAAPIALKYRTLRDPLAPSLRRRIERAGESDQLRALIGRIREACRKVTSVSETATTVTTYQKGLLDWSGSFRSEAATFKMRGDDRFVAEIDEVMHITFRIGSDGASCWFVASDPDRRIAVPSRAIAEKNVHLVDPFGVRGEADVGRIIRDRKLEYGGEVDLDGRRCHLIRSWNVMVVTGMGVIPAPRWYIDAATLLPARVMIGEEYAFNFAYARINEPIPDAEFRPSGGAIPVAEPEPLPEGFTRRYLDIFDGSDGRTTVRWGMVGPAGQAGSGRN